MPDTQIIAPRVPLIDPRTNLISREWYRYFLNLLNDGENNTDVIDSLLVTPSAQNNSIYGELLNIINQVRNVDQISSEIAVLQNEIEGLAVAPTTPEIQAPVFGSFTRSAAATATAVNTPQTVSFEAQDISQGGRVGFRGTDTHICLHSGYLRFSVFGASDKIVG